MLVSDWLCVKKGLWCRQSMDKISFFALSKSSLIMCWGWCNVWPWVHCNTYNVVSVRYSNDIIYLNKAYYWNMLFNAFNSGGKSACISYKRVLFCYPFVAIYHVSDLTDPLFVGILVFSLFCPKINSILCRCFWQLRFFLLRFPISSYHTLTVSQTMFLLKNNTQMQC